MLRYYRVVICNNLIAHGLPGVQYGLKVVDSGFFLGGCVQGTCRVPHPKGVLSQTPLGWVLGILYISS